MARKPKSAPVVEQQKHLHKLGTDVIVSRFGEQPTSNPRWKEVRDKRRLVFEPNDSMILLQEQFEQEVRDAVEQMGDTGKRLMHFRSARGSVPNSNHVINAAEHRKGKYFYITDLKGAFANLDLQRLAVILHYIFNFERMRDMYSLEVIAREPLAQMQIESDDGFEGMFSFLSSYLSGLDGKGLAFGGPASPYLFNLYCEVFVDEPIRHYLQTVAGWHVSQQMSQAECEPWRTTYTRYVDDLAFSRGRAVWCDMRKRIREIIKAAGFDVKHRKSYVLCREQGVVTITKVGLAPGEESARLTFGKNKVRRLEGALSSYNERRSTINPNKVGGLVGQFIYFLRRKGEGPTLSEVTLLERCKAFEKEAANDPRMGKAWRVSRKRR